MNRTLENEITVDDFKFKFELRMLEQGQLPEVTVGTVHSYPPEIELAIGGATPSAARQLIIEQISDMRRLLKEGPCVITTRGLHRFDDLSVAYISMTVFPWSGRGDQIQQMVSPTEFRVAELKDGKLVYASDAENLARSIAAQPKYRRRNWVSPQGYPVEGKSLKTIGMVHMISCLMSAIIWPLMLWSYGTAESDTPVWLYPAFFVALLGASIAVFFLSWLPGLSMYRQGVDDLKPGGS